MGNAKILVCCHKKDLCVTDSPYFPIHVGKALSNMELNIPGDNTGDNISRRNDRYCELTGLYWAWKNLKNTDIIGLCHYRRYFDFHNQQKKGFPIIEYPSSDFENFDYSVPNNILTQLKNDEIIVSKPYIGMPVILDYCVNHVSDDIKILKEVIRTSCDERYYIAFKKVMLQNKIRFANMFVMRWERFDAYCSWLFKILFEVENRINIENYSPYQRRIFGFMSERLLNVYILAEKMTMKEFPIISFNDNPYFDYDTISYRRYWLRCLKFNLASKLLSNSIKSIIE